MNVGIIKEYIKKNIGKNVVITEHGMRNKKHFYEGKLYKSYPNIFSIMTNIGEKSFSYADVATKEITIKYQ